ncbi:unnamed protein product [Babesia microti strain RI]|uniref:Uncharacterized protein n=1 Tax=Babesia microti (strain RI) TaxID=1133968 RepID=A0A1N6LX65_BABMR|nr:uncharacterized protein BMR1_01G03181 [Babesia microti strain RI]SIO73454.1 unnamed protein product [Babesia microti strain RI]|eukprot:XP_021337551.1 uncharacterized protein BMR1_01G03181 [Babesia microti strain RI]
MILNILPLFTIILAIPQTVTAHVSQLSSDTDLDIFIKQNIDVLAHNAIYLNYFDYGHN